MIADRTRLRAANRIARDGDGCDQQRSGRRRRDSWPDDRGAGGVQRVRRTSRRRGRAQSVLPRVLPDRGEQARSPTARHESSGTQPVSRAGGRPGTARAGDVRSDHGRDDRATRDRPPPLARSRSEPGGAGGGLMFALYSYLITAFFLQLSYQRYLWAMVALANGVIWCLRDPEGGSPMPRVVTQNRTLRGGLITSRVRNRRQLHRQHRKSVAGDVQELLGCGEGDRRPGRWASSEARRSSVSHGDSRSVVAAMVLGRRQGCSGRRTPIPGTSATKAHSYSGSSGSHPSQEKPESKLWHHDGTWWGSLWSNPADSFNVHRLDPATEHLDRHRHRARDLRHLPAGHAVRRLEAVRVVPPLRDERRLRRRPTVTTELRPGTEQWSIDSGFPVSISNDRSETLTIEKDSIGRLWATWTTEGDV